MTTPSPLADLERRLWDAADSLRANSRLKSSEYSVPVLGLIFLRYADAKFEQAELRFRERGAGRRRKARAGHRFAVGVAPGRARRHRDRG